MVLVEVMSLVGLSTKTATVVNLVREWRNPEYVRACSAVQAPVAFVRRAPGRGPRAFLVCPPSGPPNLAVCEGALAEDVDVARRIEEAAVLARATRVQQPELMLVDGEGNMRFSPSIWSGAMTAPESEAGVLSLAVSGAAHSAVIYALMTASSPADLQAAGYDLSQDGWLTLPRGTEGNAEQPAPGRAGSGSPGSPRAQSRMAGLGIGSPTNVPSVRVHIPSFLRAQHAAISNNRPPPDDTAARAAQRHGAGGVEGGSPLQAAPLIGDGATEYERMRSILVNEDLELTSVAQNARVVAACAMSHLLLTIFRLMTSDFVAAVGALSIAGYLGARYGNHAGLSVYLLYAVTSVCVAIYAVSTWAADGVLGGVTPSFITTITGRWGAVIVLATTCISIVACSVTARLLYALLRLRWAGWDASEMVFLLENPSMALLNRTTRRVAMGTMGVVAARPSPPWEWLLSPRAEGEGEGAEGVPNQQLAPPTGVRRGMRWPWMPSRGPETEDASRVSVMMSSPLRAAGATRRTGGVSAVVPQDAGGAWQPPVRPTVPLGRATAHPNSRSPREPGTEPALRGARPERWTRAGGRGRPPSRNTSAAAEGAGNVTFTAALAMML